MPASLDARPPGLNVVFRRGQAFALTLEWPAGALTGRTFDSSVNGVSLTPNIVSDTMTISMSVAQTAAASDGALPFVLTETTGDDQPIIVGTWRASTRPSAQTGATVQVTEGDATVEVTVLGGGGGGSASLPDQSQATLFGRASGAGTGPPAVLTVAQAKTILGYQGSEVAFTPTGSIAGTNLQTAVAEVASEAAAALTAHGAIEGDGAHVPNAASAADGALLQVSSGNIGYVEDLTLPATTISGGTATDGVIRRAHSIKLPWSYTQTTDPTDSAVGTAILVDADVTLSAGGGFGPLFQTSLYGPRGVFQFEGLIRYGADMSALALAPIGFGDFPTIANTAGVARTVSGGWGFLCGRSYVADGATLTLGPTDVNDGGAAFVDSTSYGTVDTGTINGTANSFEHVSFLAMVGLGGNTSMTRRVGFDVLGAYEGIHPLITEPTGAHWSGAGSWDPTTPTLSEEIGLRIQRFTLGGTRVGIESQHRIRLYTEAATLDATTWQAVEVPAVTLTAGTSGWSVQGFKFAPTFSASEDSNILSSGQMFSNEVIFKTANAQAQSFALFIGLNQTPTFQGDGATLTHTGYTALRDTCVIDRINAGACNMTDQKTLQSDPTVNAGCTVTTRRAVHISDFGGSGTITTQVGVDIAAMTKGGTNIGIRNAATEVDTPASQTLSAAGNAITATAKVKALTNSTGASLTLTSAPTIADGQNGQIIELVNVGSQDIVLQDQGTLASSNLRLTGTTITLTPRDTVRLRFNSTVGDWVQCAPVVAVL